MHVGSSDRVLMPLGIRNACVFLKKKKEPSLNIINNENRETKLKVHEGDIQRAKGKGEDQQTHLGISIRLTPP